MLEPQLEDNIVFLDKVYNNNINNRYNDSLHLLEGGNKAPKVKPKPKSKPTSGDGQKPQGDGQKPQDSSKIEVKAIDVKTVTKQLGTKKGSSSKREIKGKKGELYKTAKTESTKILGNNTKSAISGIDTKLSPNDYRRKLRETIEASVVKQYDNIDKINEAIPKDVKQLIPDYDKLDFDQKRKLLTYYLRDMSDNKNFSESSDSYNKRIKETVKGFNNYIIPKKYNEAILKQIPTPNEKARINIGIGVAVSKLEGPIKEEAGKPPNAVEASIENRLNKSASKAVNAEEINTYNNKIADHNNKIADYEEKNTMNIEALEEKKEAIQSLELKKKETTDSITKNNKKISNLENQLKNISGADVKAKRTELKRIPTKEVLEKEYNKILSEIKEQPETDKSQTNSKPDDNTKSNTKSGLNAKLSTIREQLNKRRKLEKEIKLIDGYKTEIAKITKKQNVLNETNKEQTAIIERSKRQMNNVNKLIANETQKIDNEKQKLETLKIENPDKEFNASKFNNSLKNMDDNGLNYKINDIKSSLEQKTDAKRQLIAELKNSVDDNIKADIEKKIEILDKGISVDKKSANILENHSKIQVINGMDAELKKQGISPDMISNIKQYALSQKKDGLDYSNIENIKNSIKTSVDKYIASPQYIIKKSEIEVNKLQEELKGQLGSTRKQEIESQIKELKNESDKASLQVSKDKIADIKTEDQQKQTAITDLKMQLANTTNDNDKKRIENEITNLESVININKNKMNNEIKASAKLILNGMDTELKAQGFTPEQILRAKSLVKNSELKGDDFIEKMDNAKKQLIAKISSPEFKIDINKSKIQELQKQLEDDQRKDMGNRNKIEESKLKRQISNLTNNNIKLSKQSIIMNTSTDKFKTRKRSKEVISKINNKLQQTNATLRMLKSEYESVKGKPEGNMSPGNKALISRYKKLQSDKYGMEQRREVLEKNIASKTFKKSIINQTNKPNPTKMSNKELTDFKNELTSRILVNTTTKTPNNTTKTPNKQKYINYQMRINSLTDALKRGDTGVAKAQARFLKNHIGIDVKKYTLNNINKLGSIVKESANKYIENNAINQLTKRRNQITQNILKKGDTQDEINSYLATKQGKKQENKLIDLRKQLISKQTAEPKPTQTAEPKPTQTAEPKPTQTAEPKPPQTAEPKPPQTAEPKQMPPVKILSELNGSESQVGGKYKKGRKRSKRDLCISTSKKKTKRSNY